MATYRIHIRRGYSINAPGEWIWLGTASAPTGGSIEDAESFDLDKLKEQLEGAVEDVMDEEDEIDWDIEDDEDEPEAD